MDPLTSNELSSSAVQVMVSVISSGQLMSSSAEANTKDGLDCVSTLHWSLASSRIKQHAQSRIGGHISARPSLVEPYDCSPHIDKKSDAEGIVQRGPANFTAGIKRQLAFERLDIVRDGVGDVE